MGCTLLLPNWQRWSFIAQEMERIHVDRSQASTRVPWILLMGQPVLSLCPLPHKVTVGNIEGAGNSMDINKQCQQFPVSLAVLACGG